MENREKLPPAAWRNGFQFHLRVVLFNFFTFVLVQYNIFQLYFVLITNISRHMSLNFIHLPQTAKERVLTFLDDKYLLRMREVKQDFFE